jgi:hypothetical protein
MSWELTRHVLALRNLTPVEKAVAHSLAFHAPKHGAAYPSMETIAHEAGLGSRRAAQMVMRRLETKGVISPTGSKKGGRKNPTRYQINPVNSEPPFVLSCSGNSEYGCTKNGERANTDARNSEPPFARDSSSDRKAVDSSTAAVSKSQMESELQAVWNYYLTAFDKEEIISPSKKRMGMTVLSALHKRSLPDPAAEMTFAIDMARHIVKTQPKKSYFSKWSSIFGKWDMFQSLHQQCRDEEPPEAATLETTEGDKNGKLL